MNRLIRKILFPLPYIVRWYLSWERKYRYKDISITVLPGVFHPGFFFSTNMMLEFISKQSLSGSKVLEVGAGTGILSILAAKMNADVTAIDISSQSIENIQRNTDKNRVAITVIKSDLFKNVPVKAFDWIVVNPPYYPRKPKNEQDLAWQCGEHHEYFVEFFSTVSSYLSGTSRIIMVLSDVCDLATITTIAREKGFYFVTLEEKEVWLDGKNYIFEIAPVK